MLELLSRKGEVYNHEGSHLGGKVSSYVRSPCNLKYFVSLDFILFYILYYIISLRTFYTPVLL